uniref:Uncharacterized protein n=1 Tax=Branchiostoma floridae TaxID=7739 RepID=C3ZQB1_BRAFL|eukprot:XP_002589156.1 hypothetical protein BRAFLDRAFT_84950 [Branchiostoma floridae]
MTSSENVKGRSASARKQKGPSVDKAGVDGATTKPSSIMLWPSIWLEASDCIPVEPPLRSPTVLHRWADWRSRGLQTYCLEYNQAGRINTEVGSMTWVSYSTPPASQPSFSTLIDANSFINLMVTYEALVTWRMIISSPPLPLIFLASPRRKLGLTMTTKGCPFPCCHLKGWLNRKPNPYCPTLIPKWPWAE